MQTRVNISLSADTLERLDQYALEHHMNRSQAITDLTWNAKVKYSQVRGQIELEEYLKQEKKKGSRPSSRN